MSDSYRYFIFERLLRPFNQCQHQSQFMYNFKGVKNEVKTLLLFFLDVVAFPVVIILNKEFWLLFYCKKHPFPTLKEFLSVFTIYVMETYNCLLNCVANQNQTIC